jgi:carboxylesterase type B
LAKRELLAPGNSLQVDLGYEIYAGVAIEYLKLMASRIRFAAPPNCLVAMANTTATHLKQVFALPANAFQTQCLQNPAALGTRITFSATSQLYSTEDCVFLNVYAPANASGLPVLVWIHGGGYGVGNGLQDLSAIIDANNNSFVGVSIPYRVERARSRLQFK